MNNFTISILFFFGILKLFILLAIGFALSVSGKLKKEGVDSLNTIVLYVCLPALMLSKIASTFNPAAFPYWWTLPFSAILISVLGGFVGVVFSAPFRNFKARKEFISSCAFSNCGYLPMTLVAFVCTGALCDKLLVYIFLFIIGFNILLWSLVPVFFSQQGKKVFRLKALLNPPLVATIFAVLSVLLFGRNWMPLILFDPLDMMGRASFTLVLIMVGAYIAENRAYKSENWLALITCMFAKLAILPLIVFIILRLTPLDASMRFFIFLEALMPTAVTLVIIGNYKAADSKFLCAQVFYSHIIAIATIPLWLWVFRFFS